MLLNRATLYHTQQQLLNASAQSQQHCQISVDICGYAAHQICASITRKTCPRLRLSWRGGGVCISLLIFSLGVLESSIVSSQPTRILRNLSPRLFLYATQLLLCFPRGWVGSESCLMLTFV